MRIDLHVHSNASDGTDDPAGVVSRARAAGLDVIALTDHDTQAGIAAARAALSSADDLTLVPGIELSCQFDGRSAHLLGYLFDPDDAELGVETAQIRDDRTFRAKAMIAKARELGADVSWDQVAAIADGAVVGRPHIARALAAAGAVETPAAAFTADWIADGGRAFVDRYAVQLPRGISLIRAAGGVPVLAHPRSPGYEIPDDVIAALAHNGLCGIEVFHPDHDQDERTRLTALAQSLGLIATGGSDDHGSFNNHGLGLDTTPPDEYELLLALAGSRP